MKRKSTSLETVRIFPILFIMIGIGMGIFVLYASYLAFAGGVHTETQAAFIPRNKPILFPLPTGMKGSPMLSPKTCPTKLVCLHGATAIFINGKCQCPPTDMTQ